MCVLVIIGFNLVQEIGYVVGVYDYFSFLKLEFICIYVNVKKKLLILDILKKCNGVYMCEIVYLILYYIVFLEFIFFYYKYMFGNEFIC